MFEGTQSLLIPVVQYRLCAVLQVRDMNSDSLRLTNAVQPANALFQQIRIEWQVKQNQMMGKLEIAALTANLRTDQQPRAVLVSKPGRIAIALNQGQILVKHPQN